MADDDVTLLPIGENDPDAELASLEEDLDPTLDNADLTALVTPPPPLGKSWACDFAGRPDGSLFLRPAVPVYGEQTLELWIDKCLHTERGAYPIHPPGYGMEGVTEGIGEPFGSPALADREDRIREALTFHPRITDVVDYASEGDPDDEVFLERFTVVTDEGDRLPIERTA